ncbi:SGNH/GDSL hydrolase family protein [Cellulosimicrobium cellulans]|uniref:SGNH/GDSL hydrolase family protein n=1 Tax=Cellulosimicrobium cellulans TaxID=1710 RepID=UPI003C4F92F2
MLAPLGATGDVEISTELVIGTPPSPANIILYAKYADFSNFVQCIITRTSTTFQMSIVKRIAGVFTTVASLVNMVPPSDGLFEVRAQVVGASVSLTVNDVAIEGVLTAGDATALSASTRAGFGSSATSTSGARVNRFQVDMIGSAGSSITLYNGARSGSILEYQLSRLEDMYPVAPGILLVNSIHNYGTRTVEEYLAGLDEFVDAFLSLHPGTPVVATSQNPKFPPVTNIALHAQRNAALAAHAAERGWGYIPAFEAFSALPDGGLSLMNPDGLHPSYGGRSTGAAFWRNVALLHFEQSQDAATITVASDTAWIQDPLDPRGAVSVRLDSNVAEGEVWLTLGSLSEAKWSQPVDLAYVEGSAYPVASVGQRVIAGEIPLNLSYEVMAEGGAMRRLLRNAGQLVLRGMPDDVVEPVAHVVVGDATEQRVASGSHQVATWDLTARQVRPTSMRVVVPWFTYDQVHALWQEWTAGATYDQVTATRPGTTYLDWQRDPEVP